MTIEDIIKLHEERLVRLDRYLRLAHLGRRGKESAVARKARRRLIGEIGCMLDYEQEALEADLQYLHATTPEERARDKRTEPGCWDNWDYFASDFDVVPLLDSKPIAGDDGRMFDPAIGIWYHVEAGYPKKIVATPEELGELASLIAQMQQDLGITLTANRHFWTEDALAIWVLSQDMREERDRGRSG